MAPLQYTIAGSTLNFTSGGLIANLNGTNGKIQTITSAITGAPSVNLITSSSGGDITGGIKFAPVGGVVQHLGTVTLAAGYPGSTGGADKTTLWLSGTTTGNTVQRGQSEHQLLTHSEVRLRLVDRDRRCEIRTTLYGWRQSDRHRHAAGNPVPGALPQQRHPALQQPRSGVYRH